MEQVEQRAREIAGDLAPFDAKVKVAADELGIEYISSFDIICLDERCKLFTDDGSLLFLDKSHMSVQGATWFGPHLIEALESTGNEQLVPAKKQSHEPLLPTTEFEGLSYEEAAQIGRNYMSELLRLGADAQELYDISLLPDSKPKVLAALLKLIDGSSDQEASSHLRTTIIVLAFFQPGAGTMRYCAPNNNGTDTPS